MGDLRFAGVEDTAAAFVAARRAGTALPDYPGEVPQALAHSYAIQDAAIALHGEDVAGWKLGKIGAPLDETYGANRLAGPIFASAVVEANDQSVDMPVFGEGFAAAEAEFLLRIGTAPEPGKSDYTIAEATALIDAVHAGIEVASSPYPGINRDGPAVTVSDFGNNNGLVIGAAIDNWRDVDLNAWTLEVVINGETIGTGRGAEMLDGPFGAAAFLFNHAATRGLTLKAGQWISSGAVTGVHPVAVGDTVTARFDGRYEVRCTITTY